MRAFQSWLKAPYSSFRVRSVRVAVSVGPNTLKLLFLTNLLVPSAQQEAGVVDIVVKVMVSEEQVVDGGRPEPCPGKFVRGCRSAIEHHFLISNLAR